MPIARVATRAAKGVEAPQVLVEAHLSNGLPAFNLVGLPEASVKEARERVRSAIINAGFEFPMRRITINLAPADLPKQGTLRPSYCHWYSGSIRATATEISGRS